MAYTLNRRLAQLVDSNGQLNTGKIPNDYITSDHVADNTITSAMLHTSFTVSTSNLTAIDTDDVSEGSTNLYYTTARWDTKMAAADTDDLTEGSTNLYFTNERVDDRVNALLTAGTGITLTYDDSANTLTIAGAAQYGDSDVESYLDTNGLTLPDNVKAQFGASNDLQIYHTGANSVISDAGTGSLIITANQVAIKNAGNTENVAVFNENSDVRLFYDNSIKLATTSTGIDVTGNITVSGTVDGRDLATDGTKLDGIEANATADQTQSDINALAITEVGTISSGTWQGTAIASAYLDSDTAHLSGAQTFTGVKTFASPVINTGISGTAILDEDNMASNSATQLATQQSIKAYVDAEVAGVVDSAPAALNTLNELAAALGDDANFSTTTSTALGNRLRVDINNQGLTGTQQANAITNLGITATKAELNVLDGITATTTELNHTDGVTSNIQTQLDAKLPLSGGTMTGALNMGTENISNVGTFSNTGTVTHNILYTEEVMVKVTNDGGQRNALTLNHEYDRDIGIHFHTTGGDYEVWIDSAGDDSLIFSPTTAGNPALELYQNKNAQFYGNIILSGTVDGRDIASDGSKLDGIESGATADQTAAEILTAIKTVDGAGSGLDADLLDGISSGSFLRSDANDTYTGTLSLATNSSIKLSNQTGYGIETSDGFRVIDSVDAVLRIGDTGKHTTIRLHGGGNDDFRVYYGGADYEIWHSGNDGAGSGLDADLLDGISSASFLRSDANDTATGAYTFTNNTNLKLRSSSNGVGIGIDFSDHAGGSYAQAGTINFVHSDGASYGSGAAFILGSTEATTTILANGKLMYGEGIYLKPGTGTGAGTRKDLNWDTAYSWGNHASAGYLTGITSSDVTTALGYTPYQESTALSATSGTFSGDITVSGNQVFTAATNARTKFCVWTGTTYGIGMGNGYTYGGIANNYVMSFQMSNTNDRGFWWGDSSHTNAQGAMALTTDGYLTVANGIRVGYGEADTTHPEGGLDVNGIIQCKGNDFLDSDTSSHYIKAPAHLYFYTNGSTIAGRYMSSGNFAVGPNTPGTSSTQFDLALFHLDRTNTNFFTSRNNSGGFTHRIYADYANAGSTIEYQAACGENFAGVRLQTWTDHPLTLGQSNTEILRIADNSTGTNPRVGIGSTSPSFNLHVRGSGGNEGTFGVESAGNSLFRVVANNAANAYFQGGTSSATSQIPIYFTGMNGSNNTMTVNTTNKRVGVNDTGPDIMFGVYGDSSTMGTAHFVSPKGSNESHVHYGTNGNWYIRPANNSGNVIVKNYSAESDERLKENIVDITYGLSDLIQLQPRQFNWIDDVEEREQNGFIAQEVEAIIPALVSTGEGENAYKAVDYNSIIAILVKSVQELKAENDALKTRLDNGGL